jgi:peptide-methionine (S)-S-oxide reductase
VFQSLLGVIKVEQGYVESIGDNSSFSEAVIVYFNSMKFLKTLIEIHLHTHKSRQTILCATNIDLQFIRFLKSKKEVEQIIATFQSCSERN